jgi:hypothetical protein
MSAPALAGMTCVYSGPRHEVYCDGVQRVWVDRSPIERERVVTVKPCPRCRCSAFGATKAAPR